MFTRLSDIVNSLEGLGRQVSKVETVDKILRWLPFKWDSMTNNTGKEKNLKKLSLEGAHWIFDDLAVKQEKERQDEGNNKSIVMNAEKEKENISEDDDGTALITRKVHELTMKDKYGGRVYNIRKLKKGPLKEEKDMREGA